METSTQVQHYVVNHFDDDRVVRGPYVTGETAATIRAELEWQHRNDDDWNERNNLWVVER